MTQFLTHMCLRPVTPFVSFNCCRLVKGNPPTQVGLVDAIVYSRSTSVDVGLVNLLTPGQSQLHEDDDHLVGNEDESLSRCQCCQTLTSSVFRLANEFIN